MHTYKVTTNARTKLQIPPLTQCPPQIKASATRSPLVVDCSTTSLTYAVTINYTNQNGNIKVRWDGGTDIVKPIDATNENDNTPHNMVVNLPAITPDGMTHTYIVETDGTHACQIANSVNAPLVTAVKNVKATVTEPAFGEDKYDLTVTAQFTNGSGHLITVECPSLSIAHTETAPAGGNFSYTFTDITTDNNIEHDVNVFFNETPACIASATFRSPVAKLFTAFTATAELRNCNTGFVVNFNGAFSHLTGNIIVHDITDNVELYNQPAPTGYSFSGTSMVISYATPGTHTLEAWFTSDPTHRRQTTIEVPALAQLTPIVTMGAANCNGTVTAHVDITFANYAGDLVLADENNSTLTTFSHPDPNITHSYDWILPADGNAHTLRAYFTSMPACAQTVDITTPLAPTVTIVKNTALSSLKCDGTYSYYYDINFANSTGNLLAQKAGDLTPQNLGSTSVRWLVEGMQTNAATKSIAQVWLSDFPDCKYDITETFPDAVSFNITSTIGDLQCDGTFNFNATVNFKGATTGALVILDEFGKEITRDNSPVSPFNFSYNLPADGYAHTIQAYFTDATECFGGGAITAPMAMTVNSLSETHSAVYCTETAYELYLTVETTNPQHDIIISEGATELARIPVTPVMGDATYYTTLNLDTDLKPHTLKAWFDGCPTGSVQTLTYTAPAPNECIHYYDSICQGQSFKGHGLTLGPQNDLGDFNYQVLDSTIHLHVMQEPKFSVLRSEPACNTSAEILLPVSVTQGEPDRYNISFTDAIFNNLINKPLTDGFIHIPIPAGVQAGTYAATVTLYAKGSSFAIGQRCEARVNISFDIAQDGLLYSKWQDVLLVNNVNDDFVGYQWYKNNILLEGETQQRLYNPDGLEGRYYCLLTRTDGTKIKTCVMEFDEAPRSAELLSKTQVQPHYLRQGEPLTIIRTHSGNATVSFYSVTGHCVLTATVLEQEETVRIPDDIGLFIVVIDDDNERTTEKIIIE